MKRLALLLMLVAAPVATAGAATFPGTWRPLPKAPIVPDDGGFASAWTGREVLVFGRHRRTALDARGNPYIVGRTNVAAAYDPARKTWRRLSPPKPTPSFMDNDAVWTGKEVLVWGQGTRLAYNPQTNTWRRIAPLPAPRGGAAAVWDGREILVVGGAAGRTAPRVGFAYDPATNRWRRLPPMDSGRVGAAAVWTGSRLLVWGGTTRPGSNAVPRHGLAYDPRTNSWSPLPQAPLVGRAQPTAVWTGHSMVIWGGGTKTDGAAFTPGRRAS